MIFNETRFTSGTPESKSKSIDRYNQKTVKGCLLEDSSRRDLNRKGSEKTIVEILSDHSVKDNGTYLSISEYNFGGGNTILHITTCTLS